MYLIFTASLHTSQWITNSNRDNEYVSAIQETLLHVPASIHPIIVENNGKRSTMLDHFTHHGVPVPVLYTDNNRMQFKSKGVNELLDLQEVIRIMNIGPDDMIIKLTGRYVVRSSAFFDVVLQHSYDVYVKCYNGSTQRYDQEDCILGMYAARAFYLQLWNPYSIENYPSAEKAFIRYIRMSGARIQEQEQLGLRCIYSDNGVIVDV